VSLSIATLKRLWGKIRYDSKPTSTTLNTLARYLGFEDWRDFRKRHSPTGNGYAHKAEVIVPKSRYILLSVVSVVLVVVGVVAWLQLRGGTQFNPAHFKFSSRKVIDKGVPNSVVFDYDASAASSSDSVFIQQSWDTRLTTLVSREQTQHTSIYYYPGFFEAKLVVNGRTLLEHDLLITTEGWMAAIEHQRVPVYLEENQVLAGGIMQISEKLLADNNVPLQPETPVVGFYLFERFNATSDDLLLETRVRNDFGKGSGACEYAEIRIQFEGPAVIIPLSTPGCVSELSFAGMDGKKNDLSVFGRNMSEWVNVRCAIKSRKGEVFIEGQSAKKFIIPRQVSHFVGLSFRFQGPGSVDFVKVTNQSGDVIFEDDFSN
jgi:hypothetical protein